MSSSAPIVLKNQAKSKSPFDGCCVCLIRCDNKTRQSFLTSGYLDQNLARLISTGTFPPPSVPPERSPAAAQVVAPPPPPPAATTDFRNMPYHYETANNEAAAAAAIAAHRLTRKCSSNSSALLKTWLFNFAGTVMWQCLP